MAKIANLQVVLTGVTQDFERSMNRAMRSVKSLESQISSITRSVLAFGGALTGVAAAGGLGIFIKQGMDSAAAINDLSKQLGMSIEDLKAFGAAAGSMEEGAASLKLFTEKIGEAIAGSKEAREAFLALGLSIRQVAENSTGEILRKAFDSLSKMDPASRMAAAKGVFGKGGKNLGWLSEGGEKFQTGLEDVRRTGAAISAAQANAADNAEFAWTRVKTVITSISEHLATSLAPYMQKFAEQTITWVEKLGGVSGLIEKVKEGFLVVFDVVYRIGVGLSSIFDGIAAGVLKVIEYSARATSVLAKLTDLLHGGDSSTYYKTIADSIEKDAAALWGRSMGKQDAALGAGGKNPLRAWIDDAKKSEQPFDPELARVRAKWQEELAKGPRLQALAMAEAKKAAEEYDKKIKDLSSDLASLSHGMETPFERMQGDIKTLDAALSAHLITLEKYNALMDRSMEKHFPDDKTDASIPNRYADLSQQMMDYARSAMSPAEKLLEKLDRVKDWAKQLRGDNEGGIFQNEFKGVLDALRGEMAALMPASRGGSLQEFNPDVQLSRGMSDRNQLPQLDKTNEILGKIRDGIAQLSGANALGYSE